jgi:hypothetical protein
VTLTSPPWSSRSPCISPLSPSPPPLRDAALRYLKNATGGSTPHDIEHSALTYYAEDGMDITLLMAKSGHRGAEQIADRRGR